MLIEPLRTRKRWHKGIGCYKSPCRRIVKPCPVRVQPGFKALLPAGGSVLDTAVRALVILAETRIPICRATPNSIFSPHFFGYVFLDIRSNRHYQSPNCRQFPVTVCYGPKRRQKIRTFAGLRGQDRIRTCGNHWRSSRSGNPSGHRIRACGSHGDSGIAALLRLVAYTLMLWPPRALTASGGLATRGIS